MKQREDLYSASEVIVVALKIFASSSGGTCQKKIIELSDVQDSTLTILIAPFAYCIALFTTMAQVCILDTTQASIGYRGSMDLTVQ